MILPAANTASASRNSTLRRHLVAGDLAAAISMMAASVVRAPGLGGGKRSAPLPQATRMPTSTHRALAKVKISVSGSSFIRERWGSGSGFASIHLLADHGSSGRRQRRYGALIPLH